MDSLLQGSYSGSMSRFKFIQESISGSSDQNLNNGYKLNSYNLLDLSHISTSDQYSSSMNSEDNSAEENYSSDDHLKYINQILMEEESEDETCIFQDFSALQAAEKSFYDVLGEKYPSSLNQPPYQYVDTPDDNITCTCSNFDCSFSTSNNLVGDLSKYKSLHLQAPLFNYNFQSNSQSFCPPISSCDNVNGLEDSSLNTRLFPCLVSGKEQTRKFLSADNRAILDFANNRIIPIQPNEKTPEEDADAEKDEGSYFTRKLRGRKNQHEEEAARSKKHLTFCSAEEFEQSDIFDEVVLYNVGNYESNSCTIDKELQQRNGLWKGSNGGKICGKKQDDGKSDRLVDLRTLLIQCAQAVAGNDHKNANDLLEQIRQHSSPFGDGSQRMAHCFANALEARLSGTGNQAYKALASRGTSAADRLKALKLYLLACPFLKMSFFFATQTILELSEKSSRLHIIDFGIRYGFQWPCLIQSLSERPGGPPKLRITGIDLPLPGFRPAARTEETGRRLANYCKKYNVPFEYNAIAQKWETIQLEDVKVEEDELLIVNCLYMFQLTLDETVILKSPRNAVLNLINRINPHIFIHGTFNATYTAPFFISRFREALFYYSAVFDMLEATVACEDEERMVFEKEIYGKEILNIIACEGSERVERPETYKKWQLQHVRAGFRQIQLNQEIMKKVRSKVKLNYHKDFVVDDDGLWMLQGWKGRILFALSCWKPE